MTNSDKVKVTINNLCNKYHKTSWKNILPAVFESDNFDTAIHQLVSDVQAGQPFTPLIKDLFKSFDKCDLKDVKVVFVNEHPYAEKGVANGLAFSGQNNPFLKSLDKDNESDMTYLPENGVLLLNVAMTCPIGKPKDHVPMWESVTGTIINHIAAETINTVFVFVGEETQHLSAEVGVYHPKLFIPSFPKDDKEWDSIDIFERINRILKNANKTAIDW